MLMKQHAKTEWVSLLVWSLIMGALVFFTVWLWDLAITQGMMDDLQAIMMNVPQAVRGVFGGGDFATLTTWLQFYSFGGFLALPTIAYAGMFVVGIVNREMDRRTMEFLISLPVARWQVVVSRWSNLAIALLVIQLAQFVAVLLGVASVGESVDAGRILVAELNAGLLFLAVASLMLPISILTDDYAKGVVFTLGVGYGLYFFHMGAEHATGFLGKIHGVLPFALYDTRAILAQGQFPLGDMAALAAYALAGLGLSIWLFQRKQIAV